MKRLFFALDINQKDKHAIALFRQQNLSTLPSIGKPINENNFHITLAFLGMTDSTQQDKLLRFCDEHFQPFSKNRTQTTLSPIPVTVNTLGLFQKPKVLYLGFSSFDHTLIGIAKQLNQQAKKLAIFQEERAYLPHISLYRKSKTLPNISPSEISLNLASFSLYHSQSTSYGVMYSSLKTWSLVKK